MNQRRTLLFGVILSLTLSIGLIPLILGLQPSSLSIASQGTISYGSFVIKGANVALNCFNPASRGYQPNAWQIMKDLGINCIRLFGGIEGDINGINIETSPDWAANLKSILDQARNNGIRITWHDMGTQWGTSLGIVSPDAGGDTSVSGTPIDEALAMIDKLGGNNTLHYNFLADPVVLAWSSSNEVDLTFPSCLDWNLKVCDRIRYYGGKAFLSCPANFAASPDWGEAIQSRNIIPLLQGHVDYLSIHRYGVSVTRDAQQSGSNVYSAIYRFLKDELQEYIASAEQRGWSMDQIIWGEFGCVLGSVNDQGVSGISFTDITRQAYYQAAFDVAKDLELKNLFLWHLFEEPPSLRAPVNNYAIVTASGTYYQYCADIVRGAYRG